MGAIAELLDRTEAQPSPLQLEIARVSKALFNVFNSRSESTSALRALFDNRWLWGAVLLAAGLQVAVVTVPFLQVAFGTASLDATQWAVCVAMASRVLWLEELDKLFRRVRARRSQPAGVGA